MVYTNMSPTKIKSFNVGIICEEFFHEDLRGFGGFGMTVKRLCDHFNANGSRSTAKVLLSERFPIASRPGIRRYHNTDVLIRPPLRRYQEFLGYPARAGFLKALGIDFFLTIDYYSTYTYFAYAAPAKPLLIWIRDPRDISAWDKMATIPLELKQRGKADREELVRLALEKERSIKRLLMQSRCFGRKIIFATNASFLTERAERTWGIKINPYYLPNPLPFSERPAVPLTKRPSLLFLGRLEAVKRPWMVFELARKFPGIDFYIAGSVRALAEDINRIIEKYKHLDNLIFEGLVDGPRKAELFTQSWGFINTSVHEGFPVTFQESFYYGKPVISCQNPDGLTERFGYFTGEILGEGLDAVSMDKFSSKIQEFLNDPERGRKGRSAQQYVEETHSFRSFEKQLEEILVKEGVCKGL
jgi:glycosyltransferase involved in cell wall biosynthesis